MRDNLPAFPPVSHMVSANGVVLFVETFGRRDNPAVLRVMGNSATVADVLERVCKDVGYPRTIRVDQGPKFISKDLDLWAYRRGVVLDFSRPGKPTDNAYIESLNGKFRAECLNAHWFTSIEEMRRICEDWRRDYNKVRPHSALGNSE